VVIENLHEEALLAHVFVPTSSNSSTLHWASRSEFGTGRADSMLQRWIYSSVL